MVSGPGNTAPRSPSQGKGQRRRLLAPLALVLALGAGALWLALTSRAPDDIAYDEDLCPADASEVSGVTVLLLDLTKPLAGLPGSVAGDLLRDLMRNAGEGAEVRTYLLTASPSVPRALVSRLCKPFDTRDIQVATAKDHDGTVRDCADLPAQLPLDLRRSATRFCALREAAVSRLDALAERASQRDWEVTGAYLMEALEETRMDLLAHRGSHRLHVLSDMMQHADWYSHLELPSASWDHAAIEARRDSGKRLLGRWDGDSNIEVNLHYVPRTGLTTEPDAANAHRRFWREFFGAAEVTFHDHAPLFSYAAAPVMDSAPRPDALRTPSPPAETDAPAAGRRTPTPATETPPAAVAASPSPGDAAEQRDSVARAAPAPARVPDDAPEAPEAETPSAVAATPVPRDASDPPERAAGGAPEPEAEGAPDPAPLPPDPAPLLALRTDADSQAGADAAPGQAEPTVQMPVAAAPEVPECTLEMPDDENWWRPEYPRRGLRDYGDAMIVVRYTVDDKGETEDPNIAVLREQSELDNPTYFNAFAREAVAAIRKWSFPLRDANGRPCVPKADYVTSFEFRFD